MDLGNFIIAVSCAVAQAVPVRAIGLAAYDPAGDPSRHGARFGIDMALAVVESVESTRSPLCIGAGRRNPHRGHDVPRYLEYGDAG